MNGENLEESLLNVQGDAPSKKSNIIKVSIVVAVVCVILGILITFIVLGQREMPDRKGIKDRYYDLLLDTPSIDSVNHSLRFFSSRPHIAGSHQNYVYGKEIESIFNDLKFETSIHTFPTLINYPLNRNISVTNDEDDEFLYYAKLEEDIVNDGNEYVNESIPTFNGFAPSGDVEGPLVYVNYGEVEDYEYLDQMSVDLNGAIAIVRYGRIFRGDKCYPAQQRGAIGCLIYSDPIDDGYLRGPVYPEGPYRPETSVQRGSVWRGAGDPATPGYPSSYKSPRLTYEESSDPDNPTLIWPLPTIPIQPISYGDAFYFLNGLKGQKAPDHFQGGLNITDGYYIGPGPLRAQMKIEMNYTDVELHNVFGKIKGTVEPDRYIIVGCHRDAWTYGAIDPVSGTTVLLEVAKTFGKLVEKGWKPRRTIIFASWDGEEYGLIGSVEYAERYYTSLISKAVAYYNLDTAVKGGDILELKGTPSLKEMYMEITKLVNDPRNTTKTLYEVWRESTLTRNASDEPVFDSLGSGSDFMGFINHIGVASSSLSYFDKEFKYGSVYHSNYDSYYWVSHFGDPTFEYHVTLTKLLNFAVKTSADAYVIPFNYVHYADYLELKVKLLDKLIKDKFDKSMNFTEMNESIQLLRKEATKINDEVKSIIEKKSPDEIRLRILNDRLMNAERAFLDNNDLPGKKWYRHMIFSPSDVNSYAGIVFPTIINELYKPEVNWDRVQEQIIYTSLYIDIASELLRGD